MLIDSTYFFGDIQIAQLGQKTVRNAVDRFIEKYEPKYLRETMGYAVSKLFNDELATVERWQKLRDGNTYTDANGHTQQWGGLVSTTEASPIANYVYYWFNRDNASRNTPNGEKEDQEAGMNNVSAAWKLSRAWNEMVAINYRMHDFLLNKKDDSGARVYPEFSVDCLHESDLFHYINAFNL